MCIHDREVIRSSFPVCKTVGNGTEYVPSQQLMQDEAPTEIKTGAPESTDTEFDKDNDFAPSEDSSIPKHDEYLSEEDR